MGCLASLVSSAMHLPDTLILSTSEAGKFLLYQPGEFEINMPLPPPADGEIPVSFRHHSFALPSLLDPVFRFQDQIVSYQPCDGIFENYLSIIQKDFLENNI